MGIYIKNIKKPWRCDECMFTDSLDECIFLKTDADIDGLNIDCPIVEIADRKTENSSEKPNNCEKTDCDTCRYAGECDWEPWQECPYEPKDEPTISKMEQVEDEPQTDCLTCRYNSDEWDSPKCDGCSKAYSNYEPQTDCAWK